MSTDTHLTDEEQTFIDRQEHFPEETDALPQEEETDALPQEEDTDAHASESSDQLRNDESNSTNFDPDEVPHSEYVERIAAERCQNVLNAVRAAEDAIRAFVNIHGDTRHWTTAAGPKPHPEMLEKLTAFFSAVLQAETIPWPQHTWEFLALTAKTAELAIPHLNFWYDPAVVFDMFICKRFNRAFEERESLLPEPPTTIRSVDLETLEELIEQKVSDFQIAKIYEWRNPDGHPDIKRVSKAKALLKEGKLEGSDFEPPKEVTYEPVRRGPLMQPSLHPLQLFMQQLEKLKEELESWKQ